MPFPAKVKHCAESLQAPERARLWHTGRRKKIPRGGRNSLGDFSLLKMKALGSHISVFIICDSPQKSSTVRKVYKPDLCSKARLCTTSPSRLRRATSPCRRGFGSPRKVNGFARDSPTRGAVERSRLRGCTKENPTFSTQKDRCISATAFSLRIRRGDDSRIS